MVVREGREGETSHACLLWKRLTIIITIINFGDNSLDLYTLSKVQAKEWLSNYRWDDPPLHLNIALLMRLKATAWNIIRKNQDLHDAARKFSLIPMKSGLTDPSYNDDVLTYLHYI